MVLFYISLRKDLILMSNKGGHDIVDPFEEDDVITSELPKAPLKGHPDPLRDLAADLRTTSGGTPRGTTPAEPPTYKVETPEQLRIRELEAQLAAVKAPKVTVNNVSNVVKPTPEAELTADQLRIRQLEDQLARNFGKQDLPEVLVAPNPGSETIILHVLEDGFTALGRVWYRGQEIEFEVGGQPYNDTKDRNGWSWLSLLDNEFAQAERWGKVYFRRGLWPGHKYTSDESIIAERKRARMAPTLPVLTGRS